MDEYAVLDSRMMELYRATATIEAALEGLASQAVILKRELAAVRATMLSLARPHSAVVEPHIKQSVPDQVITLLTANGPMSCGQIARTIGVDPETVNTFLSDCRSFKFDKKTSLWALKK